MVLLYCFFYESYVRSMGTTFDDEDHWYCSGLIRAAVDAIIIGWARAPADENNGWLDTLVDESNSLVTFVDEIFGLVRAAVDKKTDG